MISTDTVTEVTSVGWFKRLGDSLKSVIVGIVIFLGSFVLLWWNEGRAVHTARALVELKGAVVSAPVDRVEAANEGKPVHLTGDTASDAVLADDAFGLAVPGIKLRRKVEMYQWEEEEESKTREKVGGGTETTTTYRYSLTWSKDRIDSSRFHASKGHENPTLRYATMLQTADPVTMGAFTLSSGLVEQIDNYASLPVADQLKFSPEDAAVAVVKGETVYLPTSPGTTKPDPDKPQLGDLRISWEIAKPAAASLIARQVQATFEPWQASSAQGMGTSIQRLEMGTHSAEAMVGQMEAENTLLTWVFRLVGVIAMAVGQIIVMSPLAVFASVIPFFGTMTRSVIGLFSLVTSLTLSLLTIAIAWIAYRPVLGIALLVIAVGVVSVGLWLLRKRAGSSPPAVAA
ncbi:MAG: TMEM43 family protein [Pirellulales bacterium]